MPVAVSVSTSARLAADLAWTRNHLLPWLGRRLRGVSSGDGLTAKDPQLRLVRPDESAASA